MFPLYYYYMSNAKTKIFFTTIEIFFLFIFFFFFVDKFNSYNKERRDLNPEHLYQKQQNVSIELQIKLLATTIDIATYD